MFDDSYIFYYRYSQFTSSSCRTGLESRRGLFALSPMHYLLRITSRGRGATVTKPGQGFRIYVVASTGCLMTDDEPSDFTFFRRKGGREMFRRLRIQRQTAMLLSKKRCAGSLLYFTLDEDGLLFLKYKPPSMVSEDSPARRRPSKIVHN
jgi:hypothetical protein